MGRKQNRRRKSRPVTADADVTVGSGFREQGGWDRLLKLDHQDKLIIACIFALAVGKLLSAFFYPEQEDAAEEEEAGGFLDLFGLRL